MHRLLNRILALSTVFLAVASGLSAQTIEQHDHEQEVGAVCGSLRLNDEISREAVENTARHNPALYNQMVLDAKHSNERRGLLGTGEESEFSFYVLNSETGQFDRITAQLKFHGAWARIWVDVKDTGRSVVKTALKSLSRALDTATSSTSRNPNKGIIENDQEVFGMPPVNRFEPESPVQDFLLTDIQDGMSTGFVGGFFSSWDQGNNPGSNRMNILYIDSKEGLAGGSAITALLSTVAHEYQHLIHHRTNPNSQTLYNEGCSEVASLVLGYKDRSNAQYIRATNVPLFTWNYGDGAKLLTDYQRAMTLLYYLYEQYGEAFLTSFAKTRSKDMDRITDALEAIGRDEDWMGTLTGYVVANYIGRNFEDSRYAYRNRLSTASPTPAYTYTGATSIPATGSANVEQYASIYNVYSSPGAIKVKFNASGAYRVMAILYKGSPNPVEVRELENNQEYSISHSDAEPFDKIVFAVANLTPYAQTISWNVQQITLGVDDATSDAGSLGVTAIAPNPASGSTRVSFTNARSGEVTVQLYDTKGELVRTVVQNERYEPGEHDVVVNTSDLSNGVYMVRVVQDGQMTSRVLVVLNK